MLSVEGHKEAGQANVENVRGGIDSDLRSGWGQVGVELWKGVCRPTLDMMKPP